MDGGGGGGRGEGPGRGKAESRGISPKKVCTCVLIASYVHFLK